MQSQANFSITTTSNEISDVSFLLGSFSPLYQLYATNIFSIIASEKGPNDGRSLLVGLALKSNNKDSKEDTYDDSSFDKELFEQVESMVKECKVW